MNGTPIWCTPKARRILRRYTVLLLLLLVPVVLVGLYARPMWDDLSYAARLREVVRQGGGWQEAVAAAWQQNVGQYLHWQGLYVSAFILSFNPGALGGAWYGVTPLLATLPLLLCLWASAYMVLKRLLPGGERLALPTAVLLFFAFVQGMPDPYEGIYYFNASINYNPYFALSVLNAALAFTILWDKKGTLPRVLAGCLCSAVICGGHHIDGLFNGMVLFFAIVYALLFARKTRTAVWLLPSFLAAVVGMLFNVLAPGTSNRSQGMFQQSLASVLVKSLMRTALEIPRWLDVPLLCLFALLLPLLWWVVQNADPDLPLFRHPCAALAVTGFMLWVMILLPSLALGGNGDGRLLNIAWMATVLGLVVDCAAFLGWLVHQRKADLSPVLSFLKKQGKRLHLVALAAILCLFCIGGKTVKEGKQNMFATSLEAMYELGRGYPQRYAQLRDTWETLSETSAEDTVEVPAWDIATEDLPKLLFEGDPVDLRLRLGRFYGKTLVES